MSTEENVCISARLNRSSDIDPSEVNRLLLLPIVYAIPTYIVGIVLIYSMLKRKGRKEDFSGSFFLFLAVTLIVDLSFWASFTLQARLPKITFLHNFWAWFPEEGFSTSFIYFIETYLTYATFLNPVVLAMNRLTAVSFPLSYEELWKKLSPIWILIYFVFPLSMSFHFLIMWQRVLLCKIPGLNIPEVYYRFKEQQPFVYVSDDDGSAYVMMTCGGISLLMGAMTIGVLIYRRKQNLSVPIKKNIPEIKLLATSLLTFSNLLIEIGYYILIRSSTSEAFTNFLSNALYFALDYYHLTPVWFTILVIPNLKRKVFGGLFPTKTKTKIIMLSQSLKTFSSSNL